MYDSSALRLLQLDVDEMPAWTGTAGLRLGWLLRPPLAASPN